MQRDTFINKLFYIYVYIYLYILLSIFFHIMVNIYHLRAIVDNKVTKFRV